MKTHSAVVIALLLTACSAAAQFSIQNPLVSAVSSTSRGGGFSLTASISQPAAGLSTSGEYTLQNGSVSLIGVLSDPSGPLLVLTVTTTNTLVLRWPSSTTAFTLEEAVSVDAQQWTPVPAPPVQVESQWQVLLPAPAGNRFYRLTKPL